LRKLIILFPLVIFLAAALVHSGSLVFYESFDNLSSITNNQGVLSGSPTFAAGVKNSAFNFSNSKTVYYPMQDNFNYSQGTIEFWVKPPAGNPYGFWDIGGLGNPNSWGIYKSQDYLIMEVKNNLNLYNQSWSPIQLFSDNEWHFVVSVWERSSTTTYFKICLDGQCKSSYDGVTVDSYPNPTGNFYVGWCGWYGYSQSLIDELKIFDYAKSNEEIKNDFGGNTTHCKLYKPLSKGAVKINCSGLYVNNKTFQIKGVGYQPIPIGMTAKSIPDKQFMFNDIRIRQRDFPLLRIMGANTIRTWSEVLNKTFMDDLYNNGSKPIYVLMGFWINCNEDYNSSTVRQKYINAFTNYVNEYKDSPAVLAWMIGNENNLAYCSASNVLDDFYSLANELAKIAYILEGEKYHPVAIINGDLGGIGDTFFRGDDESLNYTDFWGINSYRGRSFGSLFTDYKFLSGKPIVITEYGIDSLNNSNYMEMQDVQADWDLNQWNEIAANSLGGTIMAYSDEWWKGADFGNCGSDSTHDFSCGHGDFPTPDGWSNEEWYGIMRTVPNPGGADIMQPRQIYYEFRDIWSQNLSFRTNLKQGWNLISVPLDGENHSIASVLSSIKNNYNSIFIYQNGTYKKLSADNEIYPTMGFWIYMNKSDNLTVQGFEVPPGSVWLYPGWNLVGFPYLEQKNIKDLVASGRVILSYNKSWSSYIPNRTLNSLEILKPGFGYWIRTE